MKEITLKDLLELIQYKSTISEFHSVMILLKSKEVLELCPNIEPIQTGTLRFLIDTIPVVLLNRNIISFRPGVKTSIKYVIEI